jgi:hypothetical protein
MSEMNWELRVPYHSRSDPVWELGLAARHLDDEDEVAVVQALAMESIHAGHETVGDVLDEIERSSPAERRARLDRARTTAGLETTTALDQRRQQRRIDSAFERFDIPGPPSWSELQSCHAPGCDAYPMKGTGAIKPVSIEKWWCPEHVHMAAEGDMSEHQPAYIGVNRNGRLIPSPKEKARIAAEVEKRDEPKRRERERREEHRRREGEAIEAAKQRFADEGEISVMGVRVRPDLRTIE